MDHRSAEPPADGIRPAADRPQPRLNRYRELVESANDVIYTSTLDGHLTTINAAGERLSGRSRAELLRTPVDQLVAPDHLRHLADSMEKLLRGDALSTQFEVDILGPNGRRIPVEVNTRLLFRGGTPAEVIGVARDISERREQERRLRHLASHDALTGLPNRRVLEEAVETLTRPGASGNAILGFIDLDNFKTVNDTLGHRAGDNVLVQIAKVLREALSPGDLLVRLGGDEFAILFAIDDPGEAGESAERIRLAVERAEVRIGGHRFFLGTSIGLATVESGHSASSVLAEADAAMYSAKERGRNRVVWSGEHGVEAGRLAQQNRWATRVRHALEQGRVEVHYQPIVAVRGGSLSHHEALVRLRTASGQFVPPVEFVQSAERFGVMSQVDRFVLATVLGELRAQDDLNVFVNLSGTTLTDSQAMDEIRRMLLNEGAVVRRLGFEITETAVVHDLDQVAAWMSDMRELGIRFALDDFGTGFSSLAYVRALPIDQIKVDGSFVREIVSDKRQRAVVAAVQALGAGLDIKTVGEGVENAATLEALGVIGVDYAQGYFCGGPARRLRRRLAA
ncbi:MAG: putative bifunctional diguanylate cyclase/phosphodiesterase [Dehalococcoidia bacterium]